MIIGTDLRTIEVRSSLHFILLYIHITRVEARSNNSTVTLRVVGGEEKEVSDQRQ
jgi:hypothetical protein